MSYEAGQTICYFLWQLERSPLEHLFRLADDSLDQIRRYRDLGDIIVAASRTSIVGHAQVIPSPCEGSFELKSVAVLGRYRRRAIGSTLLKAAIRLCGERNARRLTVSTAIASSTAIRFYLRHGFRASAIVRDAFTEAAGYPATATDGVPLNDAVEFEIVLETMLQTVKDSRANTTIR